MGVFTSVRVTCGTKRRMHKLGRHILRYVSKIWRSEHNKYFVSDEKPSRKHFEKAKSAFGTPSNMCNEMLLNYAHFTPIQDRSFHNLLIERVLFHNTLKRTPVV